jgi:PAS domain S-box-containing protein
LKLDETLSEAILRSAGEAIVATDRDGVIRFWNPGAERIFGFGAAEAIGASLDLIIPEKLQARHWQGYRQVMATGRSRYGAGDLLSVPAETRDGRRISVEFSVALLLDEQGLVAGIAAVMRDVTKRFEETKALRQKLAELESWKA